MTTPIDDSIWEKLSNGEGLTKQEERNVIFHIWRGGSFGDTQKVATALRNSSAYFREKSWQEMCKVVDNLKSGMVFSATKGLDEAVKSEWKGASRLAQADRIENQARRELTLMPANPIPPQHIRDILPKVPNYRDFPRQFPGQPQSGYC